MTRRLSLAALALAAVALPIARAQQGTTTTTTTTPAQAAGAQGATGANQRPVNDQLFAMAAAAGGLAEVTISQMGVQKATDADLKKFSQTMIADHTKANSELMALAARKGIALPQGLDPRAAFCGHSLAGLSGADFDRCYAKAQFVAHMDAVATFEAEAERGLDPDLKAFAAKTLPRIKEHLAMIKPHAMKAEQDRPDATKDKDKDDHPEK